MVDKPTTADCIEWVNNSHNVDCSFEPEQSIKQSIRAQLIAAQEMAKALARESSFYTKVYAEHAQSYGLANTLEEREQERFRIENMKQSAQIKWREAGGE